MMNPGYLDPTLVYNLLIQDRMPDLIQYLDSIPGASEDPHYLQIRGVLHDFERHQLSGTLHEALQRKLAEKARRCATESRLSKLQMGRGPSNLLPNAGYNMHPHNSSSYSGEVGHAAMYNQSSASNPRNHTATFHPLQANSTNVMIETSAFNSGTHASATIPCPNDSKIELRDAVMDNQLSDSYSRNYTETFPRPQLNSNYGYNMRPHNSSSYSGGMLTNKPGSNEVGHAAMYNQSSASNPRNHTATFHPLQANSTNVMIETSSFNSGAHASATIPCPNDSKIELRDAVMDNQLSDSYSRNHTATFSGPQLNSNDGHNMHPHNSSSYSGVMLVAVAGVNDAAKLAILRHNQLVASNSRNDTATFSRLQLNSNEGHNMHPHNSSSYTGRMLTKEPCSNEVTDAEMHNQSSGSNSRNHTVTFPPVQANLNDAQAFSPQKDGP